MIKRLILLGILASLALAFFPLVGVLQTRSGVGDLAQQYLNQGPEALNAPNLVTSVVVTYRGLDTLGEVTVLFAAAVGISLAFGVGGGHKHADKSLPKQALKADLEQNQSHPASEILKTGAELLFPLIIAFGVYIFIHGHLTPGGGFQGGVVIASGLLLMLLAGNAQDIPKNSLHILEMLAGAGYVAAGLLGLWLAGGFLDPRFLPSGTFGTLFSAGAIPVIYSLVGLKVGAELSAVISHMRKST